jgi:alanine-glyoxylate transaminase/serine-glyoxylate transaminase/serine-pyruvate transaminase
MLAGTLAGVEMGLALFDVPHRAGGVTAAMAYLTGDARMETHDAVAR